MEIILILAGILILIGAVFLSFEYPYFLVSVLVFMLLYNFNLELPIPLDLRGMLSLIIFLRLVVFDKGNLNLILRNLNNKFFILIIIFSIYAVLSAFFNGGSIFKLGRIYVLNIIALFIGFVTVSNGESKQTITAAILMSGLFATADLVYSYVVKGALYIKKITDVTLGIHAVYNHNFFGEICGEALIISFLVLIYRQKNKALSLFLSAVFLLGIIVSTSRMTFLAAFATLLIILFTQKTYQLNIKRIFVSGIFGLVLLSIVALSYSFILESMNIKSKFAEQLQYRLLEEPLSIFDDDIQKFGADDNKVQGTMRWRFYKILKDADKIFKQHPEKILFGFGTGGYSKIGEIEYKGGADRYQYSAHNFYINTISEIGIVGLLLYLFFFFMLIHNILRLIRKEHVQFSFIYILIYMLIYTVGGDPNLLERYAFLLYGGIIAEYLIGKNDQYEQQVLEAEPGQ